jgi:uracil-DNA glycosylase
MQLPKDWKSILMTETSKQYYQDLMVELEKEYQKYEVFPPMNEVFNALKFCPFSEVKVIIIGQDPYHNEGEANGLAFSVKKDIKIPPSLRNIMKERKSDLNMNMPTHGDLTKWAKQGVLLLNTILTVRAHEPLSHKHLNWQQFTDKIIHVVNKDNKPKVFVFWGNEAKKKTTLITNPNHLVITSSHPSPLSARHSFFGSNVFSKINSFLAKNQQRQIDFRIEGE